MSLDPMEAAIAALRGRAPRQGDECRGCGQRPAEQVPFAFGDCERCRTCGALTPESIASIAGSAMGAHGRQPDRGNPMDTR